MWDNECPCCKGFGLYSIPDATGHGVQVDCDRCDGIGFVTSAEDLAKRQTRRAALVKVAIFAIGLAGGIVSTAIALSHLPGVCR